MVLTLFDDREIATKTSVLLILVCREHLNLNLVEEKLESLSLEHVMDYGLEGPCAWKMIDYVLHRISDHPDHTYPRSCSKQLRNLYSIEVLKV